MGQVAAVTNRGRVIPKVQSCKKVQKVAFFCNIHELWWFYDALLSSEAR